MIFIYLLFIYLFNIKTNIKDNDLKLSLKEKHQV